MSDLDPLESQPTDDRTPESGDGEAQGSPEPGEETYIAPSTPRRRTSMFADPVVRWMAIIAVGVLCLYLVTVIAALLMGVVGRKEPTTWVDRALQVSERKVTQTPEDVAAWREYVNALLEARQYAKAQSVIDQATEAIDQQPTQDMLAAQADLYFRQKRFEEAVKVADQVRKELEVYHAKAKKIENSPESKGLEIHSNHRNILILKSEALNELGQTAKAVEALDLYLKEKPAASDVLTRRGELKAELGDKTGAEADFRAALRFIPDSEAALEGLKQIGVQE